MSEQPQQPSHAIGLAYLVTRLLGARSPSSEQAPVDSEGSAVMAASSPPVGADAAAVTSSSSSPAGEATAPAMHQNHPFFSYYASLVHQQNMLQDNVRTSAYHQAITANAADFAGKVVVDVGTGSGILALFAAAAGARKVYALEASDSAARARMLVAANGLSHIIEVIQCKVEEVTLPEKADIIVSEPMGFALIHERMLESYIIARQRFLKPGGLMFPNVGTIFLAPFSDPTLHAEQVAKVGFWNTREFFGVDLSCLAGAASADHFAQPVVGYVDPASLLAGTTAEHRIDFAGDEPASLHDINIPFAFTAARTAVCHGLAAWFDVEFPGSTTRVTLSTAPSAPGTHWYQCRILLQEPIAVNAGQRVAGTLRAVANARYSYDVTLTLELVGAEATTETGAPIQSSSHCSLADQMYSYLNAGGGGAAGHA